MRTAIYARVSTGDQHNEIQLGELRQYVERRGWTLTATYQDQMSGGPRGNKRPGLEQLMQDARKRKWDAVVVWKLDRFGRSLVHCVSGIQELASLGIRFIATSQGLDTDESNPASKLLMHILAAVAQFEHELIRERVSAGMKHARARGKRLGRPVSIVPRQKIVELRAAGMSFGQIAAKFNISKTSAVRITKQAS